MTIHIRTTYIGRTSLSSLINNNEIYNNLYRNSLSGYVNVSVMNLLIVLQQQILYYKLILAH